MGQLGTVASLRSSLRIRLGHSTDTALLPDAVVDECLKDALAQVNKFWPALGVSYFTTVANQQFYSPLPAGGRRLRRVFWASGGCNPSGLDGGWLGQDTDSFQALLGDVDEEGRAFTLQPHAVVILLRHREYLQRFFSQHAFIEEPGDVRLSPVPSTAGDRVYFVYESKRFDAVDEVTDDIADIEAAFSAWAEHKGHSILAAGRGAISSVTGPNGVQTTTRAPINHLELAKAAEDRFYGNVPDAFGSWLGG